MERLDYKHVSDFLRDQTGGELAGLLGYLKVDDEVQTQRLTLAFIKALTKVFGGSNQSAPPAREEEPVIDTTDPNFVKTFQGFNFEKPKPKRRPQNTQFVTERR